MEFLYAFLGLLPILFALVAMLFFKWHAKYALRALLICAILVLIVWKVKFTDVLAYTSSGVLNSLDVLLIVAGAILEGAAGFGAPAAICRNDYYNYL